MARNSALGPGTFCDRATAILAELPNRQKAAEWKARLDEKERADKRIDALLARVPEDMRPAAQRMLAALVESEKSAAVMAQPDRLTITAPGHGGVTFAKPTGAPLYIGGSLQPQAEPSEDAVRAAEVEARFGPPGPLPKMPGVEVDRGKVK